MKEEEQGPTQAEIYRDLLRSAIESARQSGDACLHVTMRGVGQTNEFVPIEPSDTIEVRVNNQNYDVALVVGDACYVPTDRSMSVKLLGMAMSKKLDLESVTFRTSRCTSPPLLKAA
jgi:hypothetical protein